MYKYLLACLMLMFSFTAMSADYEKRMIDSCVSNTGGEPTKAAVCAGKVLTLTEINQCLKNDCIGKDDILKKTFLSLYGTKLRNKQSCGNIEVGSVNNGTTRFSTDKSWQLCSGYKVVFQKDGNLVVLNRGGKVVWSSGTHNKGADRLAMQADGNLVIYKQSYPIWSSGTHGNPGSVMTVQEDGNLVIYNKYKKPIWATGTNGM